MFRTRYIGWAALICFALAIPIQAEAAGAGASKVSAVKVERQVKKLRKQVRKLRREVARMSSAVGATGPAGPQGAAGPQGTPGATGPQGPATGPAGGDLTGSYPNPQIVESAIGSLELAGNAITQDTFPGQAIGNYTTKIGPGAIGRNEIADGQVRAAELGTIVERSKEKAIDVGQWSGTTALCNPGERVISGGADWGQAFISGTRLTTSSADLSANGWWAGGHNSSAVDQTLYVHAYCLS